MIWRPDDVFLSTCTASLDAGPSDKAPPARPSKSHPSPKERPAAESGRVLLLSLMDSASGTNLTSANHVVLFHPVIAGSREEAVACEMQAVGRALRAGQKHPVKIWRFVVVGTVEQKITEEHQNDLWERFRAGNGSAQGEVRA